MWRSGCNNKSNNWDIYALNCGSGVARVRSIFVRAGFDTDEAEVCNCPITRTPTDAERDIIVPGQDPLVREHFSSTEQYGFAWQLYKGSDKPFDFWEIEL